MTRHPRQGVRDYRPGHDVAKFAEYSEHEVGNL